MPCSEMRFITARLMTAVSQKSGGKTMSIIKREFGTAKSGEKVFAYKLENGEISAEILSYGGVVRTLCVKDRNGKTVDVVMGYDTLEEYENKRGYYGALVGRNSNRIANSEFVLNGKTYKLEPNDGRNNLHGGEGGFSKRVWDVIAEDGAEPSLVLSLTSPDGEEGFPGTIDVTVTYTLTSKNALMINYKAKCDEDTICNMTNHSYFNLNGHDGAKMTNQLLKLNSQFYTPNTDECIPNGEVLKVDGTPFDFREAKQIGDDIDADFEQTEMFGGYDHNFAVAGEGYRLCAVAENPANGIVMETYTNQPGVQLYTTNIDNENTGKHGAKYANHHGFCLETQAFPNAAKFTHFPSPVLKKNAVYDHTTEYRFSVK